MGSTKSYTLEEHLEGLVEASDIDQISLSLVITSASVASDADPALNRLERTLVMVRRMLARGFQAVDLEKGDRSTPWPNQDPDFICQRVREEWFPNGVEDAGNAAFAIWFDLPKDRR